ncbi:hypothetical protein N9D99_08685 [Gammaproteobacteria bacterium]|nr:hypothetical protein [Gammaproteobacteria bacterium]
MSYFPLSRIEECLPASYDHSSEDSLFQKPRILNIEFYKLLASAIDRGQVKIYSASQRLLTPAVLGNTVDQYLNQNELNLWLKENRLSYRWKPEKIEATTLSELQDSGELKLDCRDIVYNLKARGIPSDRIDKQRVATELTKTSKYENYQASTIFQRIRRWW